MGLLAVGLGIGAAVASMPGIASADSSDLLSSIDSLVSGLSAADVITGDNLAISVDGVSIVQEGSAHAYSGTDGDIAFASGADATATATGTDDYAIVYGNDSSATAGGPSGTLDTAFVDGNDDNVSAGGTSADPGSYDISEIWGNGDTAAAGGDAAGPGSNDAAYVEGNNLPTADALGSSYLIDVVKTYDDPTTGTTSGASEAVSLADLTSGADGSNLLTDLMSAIDPGAAADSSNLLADLASLF